MTYETLTNPLFLAAYLCAIIALAALIAFLIINFEQWQTKKHLDQISAKYKARADADLKHHREFCAQYGIQTKL